MRLCVIGHPGTIQRSHEKSTQELFKEVGHNTGNLVFWYAFGLHVEASTKTYTNYYFDPALVNRTCDVAVLILANQLSPATDMGFLADRLEQLEIPLVAFGLGAQAQLASELGELKAGTVRFAATLSQKVQKLGVRGKFTQACLTELGIENTEVLGCISNFINPQMEEHFLGLRYREIALHNLCINSELTDFTRPFHRMMGRLTSQIDCRIDFSVQAPAELLSMARGEPISDQALVSKVSDILASYRHEAHDSLVRAHLIAHFDCGAWLEWARRYTFAIGPRLHGNMVCFQAGVPTVFVMHDSRTEELAEAMQLPRLRIADCARIDSMETLMAHLQFEADAYVERRRQLMGKYAQMLRDVGLTLSATLSRSS